MRINSIRPIMLAGLLTLGLTTAHADIPQWCKTLGGETAANSPACQEPTGQCSQLAAQARKLAGEWLKGKNVVKSPGVRANTQMRGGVPRIVYRIQKKDAARLGGDDAKDRQLNRVWALYRRERQKLDTAEAMMANAEDQQPAVLDRMGALDCASPDFFVVSAAIR